MKKITLLFITMVCLTIFTSCGKRYVCIGCDRTTSTIYYDIDGEASYCEDCAKEYWIPFDYKEYQVK